MVQNCSMAASLLPRNARPDPWDWPDPRVALKNHKMLKPESAAGIIGLFLIHLTSAPDAPSLVILLFSISLSPFKMRFHLPGGWHPINGRRCAPARHLRRQFAEDAANTAI